VDNRWRCKMRIASPASGRALSIIYGSLPGSQAGLGAVARIMLRMLQKDDTVASLDVAGAVAPYAVELTNSIMRQQHLQLMLYIIPYFLTKVKLFKEYFKNIRNLLTFVKKYGIIDVSQ
jgi:hypothetical protein